jgi:hypothetical protein
MVVFPAMSTQTTALYTRIGVMEYERERMEASKGDLAHAAKSLNNVVEFRTSKVPSTGDFAQILDTFRASVVREIIARMRTLSGEDLGGDPKPWMQKYYKGDALMRIQQDGTNGTQPLAQR